MRPILLLALLTAIVAAADNVPDLAVARAAFGAGAPHRAAMCAALSVPDDGRVRVAVVKQATLSDTGLTVTATDLATGGAITATVDAAQGRREPSLFTLPDGRVAAARVIAPTAGDPIAIVTAITAAQP